MRKKYEKKYIYNFKQKVLTTNIERIWKDMKQTIQETAEEVLGKKKQTKNNKNDDQRCHESRQQNKEARIKWLGTRKEQDGRE